MGFPGGKRLVTCFTYEANVYVTNDVCHRNIGRPWLRMRRQLHAALVTLARLRSDIHVAVKCHPQCPELEEIRAELEGAPANLTILTGNATGLNLIVNSAVVIGFQTTALIETMLTAAPILYTSWAEEHQRYLDWLIPLPQSGACYLPASAEELLGMVQRLLDGELRVSAEMLASRRAFASRYIESTQGCSCERILRDIAETLSPRKVVIQPARQDLLDCA
jgi:hypothetical protein